MANTKQIQINLITKRWWWLSVLFYMPVRNPKSQFLKA